MSESLCQTCKFWTGDRKKGGQGECRRHPPQCAGIVPVQNFISNKSEPGIVAGWPSVGATAWCGEHASAILM